MMLLVGEGSPLWTLQGQSSDERAIQTTAIWVESIFYFRLSTPHFLEFPKKSSVSTVSFDQEVLFHGIDFLLLNWPS